MSNKINGLLASIEELKLTLDETSDTDDDKLLDIMERIEICETELKLLLET